MSPKSLSWTPSQPLAEVDDEVDNHLALNKQLKYALSALKPSRIGRKILDNSICFHSSSAG